MKETAICETCKKEYEYYSSSETGKYCSIDCRNNDVNYINPMKGKKRQDLVEYNKKEKPKQIQEKNPNWRGGTAREGYNCVFNDKLKEQIRKRDNSTCPICKEIESLCVHHIDYNKKNSTPYNLITLCKSCHAKTNFNRDSWRAYFKELIAKRLKIKYGKIAVMIANKDRPTELALLLQSLRTQRYPEFDIFIRDDCSGTHLTNYHFFNCVVNRLRQEGHKVFLKRNEFTYGVSRNRQALVEDVLEKGDYKVLARYDDDVILEPDYQEKLLIVLELGYSLASGVTVPMQVPTFKRNPRFLNGVVNRVVLDDEGKYIFNGDDCGMEYIQSSNAILPAHHFRSCALIKREVHEKVKYYPTKLSKHGFREEQIFSYNALMNGFKIGVDLGAVNYHQITPSGGERPTHNMSQFNQEMFEEFTKENKDKLKEIFGDYKFTKQELMRGTNLA